MGGRLLTLLAQRPKASPRLVGYGGFIPTAEFNNSAGTYDRVECRSYVRLGRQAVKRFRLVYYNGYLPQGVPEANGSNAITIEAAMESVSPSSAVRVTFGGGNTTVTLAPGEIVESDWIDPAAFSLTTFPALKAFYARTGVTGFGTGKWPQSSGVSAISGENHKASSGGASQILGTGALTGSNNVPGLIPLAIVGEWAGAADVSVAILGDSIITGPSTSKFNGLTGGSYTDSGLASVGGSGSTIPFVKLCRSGGKASEWQSGNANPGRERIMRYCTHMIEEYGVNDMRASVAGATVLADKRTLWAKFRQMSPKGYIVCTPVSPNVKAPTDTPANLDSYTTYTGQTAYNSLFAQGADRDTLNASVAGYVGTEINEVVDTMQAWEASQANWPGRGVWVIGTNITFPGGVATGDTANFATLDGTHPQVGRHTEAAALITAAAASWAG